MPKPYSYETFGTRPWLSAARQDNRERGAVAGRSATSDRLVSVGA